MWWDPFWDKFIPSTETEDSTTESCNYSRQEHKQAGIDLCQRYEKTPYADAANELRKQQLAKLALTTKQKESVATQIQKVTEKELWQCSADNQENCIKDIVEMKLSDTNSVRELKKAWSKMSQKTREWIQALIGASVDWDFWPATFEKFMEYKVLKIVEANLNTLTTQQKLKELLPWNQASAYQRILKEEWHYRWAIDWKIWPGTFKAHKKKFPIQWQQAAPTISSNPKTVAKNTPPRQATIRDSQPVAQTALPRQATIRTPQRAVTDSIDSTVEKYTEASVMKKLGDSKGKIKSARALWALLNKAELKIMQTLAKQKWYYKWKIDWITWPNSFAAYNQLLWISFKSEFNAKALNFGRMSRRKREKYFSDEYTGIIKKMRIVETTRRVDWLVASSQPEYISQQVVTKYIWTSFKKYQAELSRYQRSRRSAKEVTNETLQIIWWEWGLTFLLPKEKKWSFYMNTVRWNKRNAVWYWSDMWLWQINTINVPMLVKAGIISEVSDLLNYKKNIDAMMYMYIKWGWKQWHSAKALWLKNK